MGLENSLFKADFSARASYRHPSILIAYTLTSGCGQNHEWESMAVHVQFCVKFERENRWEPYLGGQVEKADTVGRGRGRGHEHEPKFIFQPFSV